MYNIIVYQSCNNNCIMCIHYELGEMTHTVFPRNLVAARFYFKALFGATTIQGRLDIESGVCRDRQTCGFDNQHCSPFVRLSMNNAVYSSRPFTMWRDFEGGIYWDDLSESAVTYRGW